MTRMLIVVLLVAAAAVLPACAPSDVSDGAGTQVVESQPSGGNAVGEPATVGDASAVTGLAPSQKRAMIASDFPAEVPAPDGTFSNVVGQSGNAWDYEVEVDARAADLMRWYLEAYVGRSWTTVDEGRLDEASAPVTYVVLRKGAAETRVRVFGEAQQRPARAVVTVGVGAAVLETQ